MHGKADNGGEKYRAHRPGQAQLPAQNPGGKHNGQNIYGRTGIQKGSGRTYSRTPGINPGKKREHRAGTNRQDGAGHRGHGIGKEFIGLGPEIFDYRGLGDKHGNGPGNKKGRYQAGQNVLPGVFPEHHERLQPGLADYLAVPGHVIGYQEKAYQQQQLITLFYIHLPLLILISRRASTYFCGSRRLKWISRVNIYKVFKIGLDIK